MPLVVGLSRPKSLVPGPIRILSKRTSRKKPAAKKADAPTPTLTRAATVRRARHDDFAAELAPADVVVRANSFASLREFTSSARPRSFTTGEINELRAALTQQKKKLTSHMGKQAPALPPTREDDEEHGVLSPTREDETENGVASLREVLGVPKGCDYGEARPLNRTFGWVLSVENCAIHLQAVLRGRIARRRAAMAHAGQSGEDTPTADLSTTASDWGEAERAADDALKSIDDDGGEGFPLSPHSLARLEALDAQRSFLQAAEADLYGRGAHLE